MLYPSSRESFCQSEFWQWQSLALQILAAACNTQNHIRALHCSTSLPCITSKHCTSTLNVLLLYGLMMMQ